MGILFEPKLTLFRMPRSRSVSCQPVPQDLTLSWPVKVWQDVRQPPTPYTYNNYAKMQMGFLQGGCASSACSRMRETVWMILVELGDVHACVPWYQMFEKAIDLL